MVFLIPISIKDKIFTSSTEISTSSSTELRFFFVEKSSPRSTKTGKDSRRSCLTSSNFRGWANYKNIIFYRKLENTENDLNTYLVIAIAFEIVVQGRPDLRRQLKQKLIYDNFGQIFTSIKT